MAKINRLGWAAGVCFTAYGIRVGIRVSDPVVLGQLCEHLPPGWTPTTSPFVDRLYSLVVGGAGPRPGVRRFHLLYGDSARLARTMDLDKVLESLDADLNIYLSAGSRRKLFVHAGVVEWHGRAIVLPGSTFTGKSTLVAALVRAGATYYSDEYAVFDGWGRVHPFPRPLSLRDETSQETREYSVEELGGAPGVKALPVDLVVLSRYRSGARWRPRLLSPGQGVLGLLSNTVAARRRPEAAVNTLTRAVSRARVLQGVRGEAESVVAALLNGAGGW